MALGDHLRADEHVDLAVAKLRQQRRRSRRGAGSCRDPRARRAPGSSAVDFRFDALGAEAELLEVRAGALARRPSARASSNCSSGSARGRAALCTVSETLQFGHSSVSPHCRQNTTVAKPRRLSSTIACSAASSRVAQRVAQRRG